MSARWETKLEQQAIRSRWPIPDDVRSAIVARQIAIATDNEAKPRESTAAAKCLLSMEEQNERIPILETSQDELSRQELKLLLEATEMPPEQFEKCLEYARTEGRKQVVRVEFIDDFFTETLNPNPYSD